jgi:hypothetical protein
MLQTTLSVPLEVKPESCSRLSALIDTVKRREDVGRDPLSENFARLIALVPCLHFMSMSVFPAADYDPIFILEANFDGAPGPFWGQLEAVLGEDLRAMLRCCKRPLDGTGTLYDAVTALGSRAPVAPYLEKRTQQPSVFHHGNRGLLCPQIRNDYALFLALRDELDKPPQPDQPHYHSMQPTALHAALRAAMLPAHPWLNQPAPERISAAENRADWGNMIGFALALMLVLSSPGLLLAALVPWRFDLLIMVVLAFGLSVAIYVYRRGLEGTEIKTRFNLPEFLLGQTGKFVAAGALYLIVPTLLLTAIVAPATDVLHHYGIAGVLSFSQALLPCAHVVFFGLIGLLLMSAPLLLLLVRLNEMKDSSQDAPHTNEHMLREMYHREDWIQQNHMGSIVLIKPGILRSIIIRAGHRGLFLVLRLLPDSRKGYLGSMRTVHFAHWAFLNNGSRLLFFSNFDHSWGSYLDDFIEKAHAGLTLAWGCGVGFPPTRFLVEDGASHGRQFKAWALASRAVSRFWYSAYPDLTVDQVERNNRIALGLRQASLRTEEATTWMQDL